MPRPIIVPLDRSAFAEQALPLAADIAARLQQPLQLTLVHQPVPMLPETALDGPADLDAQIRTEEQAYLDQLVGRLSEQGGVSVVPVVLDGPVAQALIENAKSRESRLVVMTTHGRRGLSRLFLGSVADRLIQTLHCPVVLVRPGSLAPTLRPGVRRRVLVPLDGSALAESVIDQVLAAFGADQVTLDLVQVVAPFRELFASVDAPLTYPSNTEDLVAAANTYLHAVLEQLRKRGLTVEAEARIGPSPAHAILDQAEDQRSDLIAVATHGRGGVERMLLGSVADKLVRSARVPLLVWNPPAYASSEVVLQASETIAQPFLPVAVGC